MGAKLSTQEEAAEQAQAQLAVISTRLSRQIKASTTRRLQVQLAQFAEQHTSGYGSSFCLLPSHRLPAALSMIPTPEALKFPREVQS